MNQEILKQLIEIKELLKKQEIRSHNHMLVMLLWLTVAFVVLGILFGVYF